MVAAKETIASLEETNRRESAEKGTLLSSHQSLSQQVETLLKKQTELTNELQSEKNNATLAISRADAAENEVTAAKRDAEQARTEATAATAAAASRVGASDGVLSPESLKQLMQDVYAKACEMFVNDDMDDEEREKATTQLKVLRAVLKAVTKDRS